jgi:DNA-directed RNA polymerase subunit M/transcription elongation factor TFIIS
VVAPLVAAVLAEVALMATESGMGWQLGISGEQAMAGLAEYARKIRAEADQAMPSGIIQIRRPVTDEELEQFTSRWNEDRNAFRVTELYSGPSTVTPYPVIRYEVPPVEAFAECPACHIQHYPLIITLRRTDELLIVVRECQHCAARWQQHDPA